ncbi:MAG TPA: hypothetical protein VHN74_06710 [Candidatus Angelobacter sp.]|jgi:hypothetical protein|nr:hypothetical protein [Candidatus Angelobacter sp.]
MSRLLLTAICVLVFCAYPDAFAQSTAHEHHQHSPQSDDMAEHQHHSSSPTHAHVVDSESQEPADFINAILMHTTPGTSAEPNSVKEPMYMQPFGSWMFMFHGAAFLNFQQQSGPRGGDKIFSTNWAMPMIQYRKERSQLTLRAMFSLEPATVTHRVYPELFQQGETAFGRPITDGQHPHDFMMEIAGLYDHRLGRNALASFYAALVGDPAMGPAAYEHRMSAAENPLAPLGHHLEDSTHIANDVLTGGFAYKRFRIEASGFHGREPDEFRWNLDAGAIDSWSTRLTVQPGQKWSGQYSFAHLTSPEQLHPGEDVQRMTASIMYNRPLQSGNWSSLILWGRNHALSSGLNTNGYLLESTLRFARHNNVWTRIENVDRTTELLLGGQPEPPGFDEDFLARVQAYTFGYSREFPFFPGVSTAIGGQLTFYTKPESLTTLYGQHPMGGVIFLRVRPAGNMHHH